MRETTKEDVAQLERLVDSFAQIDPFTQKRYTSYEYTFMRDVLGLFQGRIDNAPDDLILRLHELKKKFETYLDSVTGLAPEE